MITRKRKNPGRYKQDPDELEQEPDEEQELQQQPSTQRGPRGSVPRQAPTQDAADEHGGDSTAAAAVAAAAAAAGGGGGGGGDGEEGLPAERIAFNQAEADAMMQQIQELEEAAEGAQDRAATMDIPAARLENLVAVAVRFVLFRNHEKPGVPIKRQDINDVIHSAAGGRGGKGSKSLPGLVLPCAAARLARVFGLEMREVVRASGATNEVVTYVLHTMLPTKLCVQFCQDRADDAERGFIALVLGLIQLNNGKMDAEELWRHLSQCGLSRGEGSELEGAGVGGKHPSKLLEAMERGRYLVSSKQAAPGTDTGQVTVYEWGEAAADEMMDEAHGGMAPGGGLKGLVDQWLGSTNGGGQEAEGEA